MTIGKPFKKGQSGNPGGRPKVVAEVKELARAHTGEAIETLVSIMTNPKSAPAARVSAANALLDRGYGKPPQHITGEGGPSYVVRLPEPCTTAEEWVASLGDRSSPTPSDGWRLNDESTRLRSAAVHKLDPVLTPRLTKASVVSLNAGREKWTIKTKTIKTKIKAPLTQARPLLEALEAPLVVRWLAR